MANSTKYEYETPVVSSCPTLLCAVQYVVYCTHTVQITVIVLLCGTVHYFTVFTVYIHYCTYRLYTVTYLTVN